MENDGEKSPLFKMIAIGAISGVVAGLACFFVFNLVGTDVDPAIIGGVSGGVAGSIVPILLIRISK